MQLTEKLRNRILFALPELPEKEAEKIAAVNGVSTMTVYRWWKKLKTEDVESNNITMAIAELALSKLHAIKKLKKKQVLIMKQLSAA
jgi:predicted site-specific integrase-resolvase